VDLCRPASPPASPTCQQRGEYWSLASWSAPLNLKERHLPEHERVIVAVTDRLPDHEEWLLVVDNLDRASVSELRRLWPAV
jgi:hypothetical protein